MSQTEPAIFRTDSYHGQQVTFVEPDTPPPEGSLTLTTMPHAQARSAGVVRGDLSNASGNEGNTMMTSAAPLKNKSLTVWRFAGYPSPAPGSFSVGISTEKHFSSSWGMRWISQRSIGNLCGRGMLRGSWAEPYDGQSMIDWYIEVCDDIVDVYIAVNNVFQGHAFQLDFRTEPELIPRLRPAVSFDDSCLNLKACIVEFEPVPIPTGAPVYRTKLDPPRTTAEGDWELIHESFADLVLPEVVRLTITSNRLSLAVCNHMNAGASFNSDGTVTVNENIMMTRKAPAPEFAQGERVLRDFLPTITQWRITNNELVLNDRYRFRPKVIRDEKVTSNVFLEE